jgi:hypothetical protein
MLLVVCPVNGDNQEGIMNPVRVPGALCRRGWRAWRQACLRQAGYLGCNPLGIIAGLAVMVGTVEIWSHRGEAGMWAVLLAVCVLVALVPLAVVRLLAHLTVVGPARRQPRLRSTAAGQRTGVPEPQPGPLAPQRPLTGEIAGVPAGNGVLVLEPGSTGRLGEPERVKEPV